MLDGRYGIERELGRGGMGRVLLVTDTYSAGDVPYAAKVLEIPALHGRFMAEVELLKRTRHPAFVTPYATGYDGSRQAPYFISEACLGPCLEESDPDGRAPADVLAGLLRGLDHLHRLGFAHGDIAPANLLWNVGAGPDAAVKILDLGVSGKLGSGEGSTSGVLHFVAPERLSGSALSEQADLWSLGAVLFGLVYGAHPWPNYPGRPVTDRPERVDGQTHALDPVLDRLLARAPSDRFPSAAAALEALASCTDSDRPLVTKQELCNRLRTPPFVDPRGQTAAIVRLGSEALNAGQPWTALIAGPAGSGRTRAAQAVCDGFVADGMRVVSESPLPADQDGALLKRLLARLGADAASLDRRPATIVQEFLALVRETGRGPTVLIIDDFNRVDDLSGAVLAGIVRSGAALPERSGPLAVVMTSERATPGAGHDRQHNMVDAVHHEIHLEPWGPTEVERALANVFPGRRVGVRVSAPLVSETSGVPGVLRAVTDALVAEDALTVDVAAVLLDTEKLATLTLPTSMAQAAQQALEGLSPELRRLAACVAWSVRPLPATVSKAIPELLSTGVAVARRPGTSALLHVTLRSAALTRQARTEYPATEIHAELGALWSGAGPAATSTALAHRLLAGDQEALVPAAALIGRKDLDAIDARLLLSALMDSGWPSEATDSLTAATLAARIGDVATAETLFERASKAEDGQLGAIALTRLGSLQARQARHQQATIVLARALELGGSDMAPPARAELLSALSRSAVLSGSSEDAEVWAAQGYELAGEDPTIRGKLVYTRGLAAWYRGALDEAEGLFNEAKADAERANDQIELGAIVTAQGLVAHRRGQLDQALKQYTLALSIGERAGDDARVLTALQNLGVVHHEKGDWMRALDTYREAMALAEALDQPSRVVQLTGNVGNLWRYLGELGLAETVLKRGIALARREKNVHLQAIIETMLAEVAMACERWDDAGQHLQIAVERSQHAQATTEEVEAELDLARLHLEQQRFPEATASAKRASELSSQIGSDGLRVQGVALQAASQLRSVHGDSDLGHRLLKEAVGGVESITNPDRQWPVLVEAAWAAARQGDLRQASVFAGRVQGILQALEDAVPAEHRVAFRALRERRQAAFEASIFHRDEPAAATTHTTTAPAASGGWERLLEINKRLNTEYDVKRLLEYIMDSAILLTGAERGFLLLDDGTRDDEQLSIKVARNIDQENIRNVRLKISHSIARRVIATGEPALTIDAMEDDRYAEQLSVHDLKLRSVLCLPMRVSGRVLGAIYLDNRFQRSAFGDGELRFMEAFADQAAIALGNARVVEAMEKQRDALEQAQNDIKALNEQLAGQLKAQAQELENTHRVVIRQQRQLEQKHTYEAIIGSSGPLRQVFAVMDRLLDNAIPVLIEGESGTGKELVARAIHYNGTRKDRPFVAINCGAIPSNLLESELFGHVRGAFTGATSDKQGLFQAADKGTLLLDELGELPLEMQVKLLRVLQNGEIKKVGATRDVTVDVRIIAATNRKLEEEVAAGRFREDLYYRLSVVPIQLPPLRDRPDDIPLLVSHFIKVNLEAGLSAVNGISPAALTLLSRYGWPGNVRQLEMVLKNASLFADTEILSPEDFDSFPDIISAQRPTLSSNNLAGRTLADIEREAIIAALQLNRGNKKRSAEQLGIDRRTLYNKLKAYNILIQKEFTVQ